MVLNINKRWFSSNWRLLGYQLSAIRWIAKTFNVAIVIEATSKVKNTKFVPSLKVVLKK